jgi:hypothetical protein
MNTVEAGGYRDCVTASWLSVSLGIDPRRIDAMRRAGELIAVRAAGSTEWLYPGWQVAAGKVRDCVPLIAAAARDTGLDEAALYRTLTTKRGLSDGQTLAELIVADQGDQVVSALREG